MTRELFFVLWFAAACSADRGHVNWQAECISIAASRPRIRELAERAALPADEVARRVCELFDTAERLVINHAAAGSSGTVEQTAPVAGAAGVAGAGCN